MEFARYFMKRNPLDVIHMLKAGTEERNKDFYFIFEQRSYICLVVPSLDKNNFQDFF